MERNFLSFPSALIEIYECIKLENDQNLMRNAKSVGIEEKVKKKSFSRNRIKKRGRFINAKTRFTKYRFLTMLKSSF